MAKMLICPRCGSYQEDTTGIRKAGVAVKKGAMFVGQQALKYGTQAVVSSLAGSVGIDTSGTINRGVGRAGVEFAKNIGIDPSKVNLDDVQYKCSACACYWNGLDEPSLYNEKQMQTVREHKEQTTNKNKAEYEKKIKGVVIGAVGLFLAFILWVSHTTQTTTDSLLGISYTATEYSWHTYLSIILFIIFVPYFLAKAISLKEAYKAYSKVVNADENQYAQEFMNLGTNKK